MWVREGHEPLPYAIGIAALLTPDKPNRPLYSGISEVFVIQFS